MHEDGCVRMVLKAIREFIGFCYRKFKIIVLLNLISILPLYIILLVVNHFWFDNIEISKKGFIIIRESDIKQNVWVVLSAMDDESIAIGMTDDRSQIKDFVENMKSGRIENVMGNTRVAIEVLMQERRDAIEMALGDSRLLMDIRYIKKNATVVMKVNKHATHRNKPLTLILVVPVFIIASLLLPISMATRSIMYERFFHLRNIPGIAAKTFIKSLLLSSLYGAILFVSLFNISFLKNYDTVVFAIILVINFWIFVFTFISSIWLFPVASQDPSTGVSAIIKYTYQLMFKKILISVFIIFLISLVLFIVATTAGYNALIVLFVFPGVAGLLLFLNIFLMHITNRIEKPDTG